MGIERCSVNLIAASDSPNVFMINLVSTVFAMFKMSDDGNEPGTRCKILHESNCDSKGGY